VAWTKRELDEALIAYERELVKAGRTLGTITTYVGDARRFVDWLDGGRPTARSWTPRPHLPRGVTGAFRRVPSVGLIPPPPALRELVRSWVASGRPGQVGIAWPRDRWTRALPRQRSLLHGLPDLLDRDAVRRVAAGAAESEAASEAAFIATMVWGFGWVGYGPHRTSQMLALSETRARLNAVARAVRDDGAAAAYIRLASDCRIKGLGPAFGTKFVAFCQPMGARPMALIHDELVSSWLTAHGRLDLASRGWSPATFGAYLFQMHAWADGLDVSPETVEYLIFQSVADARGNQWATPRGGT